MNGEIFQNDLSNDVRGASAARLLSLTRVGVELSSEQFDDMTEQLAIMAEEYGVSPDDIQQVLRRHEPELFEEEPQKLSNRALMKRFRKDIEKQCSGDKVSLPRSKKVQLARYALKNADKNDTERIKREVSAQFALSERIIDRIMRR